MPSILLLLRENLFGIIWSPIRAKNIGNRRNKTNRRRSCRYEGLLKCLVDVERSARSGKVISCDFVRVRSNVESSKLILYDFLRSRSNITSTRRGLENFKVKSAKQKLNVFSPLNARN